MVHSSLLSVHFCHPSPRTDARTLQLYETLLPLPMFKYSASRDHTPPHVLLPVVLAPDDEICAIQRPALFGGERVVEDINRRREVSFFQRTFVFPALMLC